MDPRAVGAVFGAAFADDPVWRWLVGRKAARVVAAITQLGCEQHPAGFTLLEGKAESWWHPPGSWRLGLADTLRLVPRLAPVVPIRSLRLLRMSAVIESQHPTEPHAYLGYLGAAVQGNGYGAAVLAPTLEVVDAFGWPAYLESSNPRNLPFYRRHGFVDRPPLRVPDGCPPITPMWREPA